MATHNASLVRVRLLLHLSTMRLPRFFPVCMPESNTEPRPGLEPLHPPCRSLRFKAKFEKHRSGIGRNFAPSSHYLCSRRKGPMRYHFDYRNNQATILFSLT